MKAIHYAVLAIILLTLRSAYVIGKEVAFRRTISQRTTNFIGDPAQLYGFSVYRKAIEANEKGKTIYFLFLKDALAPRRMDMGRIKTTKWIYEHAEIGPYMYIDQFPPQDPNAPPLLEKKPKPKADAPRARLFFY